MGAAIAEDLGWPHCLQMTKRVKGSQMIKWVKGLQVCWIVYTFLCPVPLQVIGRENLPSSSSPAVYVANHQSFMVRGGGREGPRRGGAQGGAGRGPGVKRTFLSGSEGYRGNVVVANHQSFMVRGWREGGEERGREGRGAGRGEKSVRGTAGRAGRRAQD